MSTRRLGVGVAVLSGYLYAVGGSDGTSPLNTGKSEKTYHIVGFILAGLGNRPRFMVRSINCHQKWNVYPVFLFVDS